MDKSCGCIKQGPTSTDVAKSVNLPASESDAPSSSNPLPSYGPESQPKMETDAVPSSSGTSKNHMFRIGMPLNLKKKTKWYMPFKFCLRGLSFLAFILWFHILKCLSYPGLTLMTILWK